MSAAPNPEHVVLTPAPVSSSPVNITTRADPPTISNSIRIVDGLYLDRFSRQHAWSLGEPSTSLASFSPIDNESEKLLHAPLDNALLVSLSSQTFRHDARQPSPTLLYQTSPPLPAPRVHLPPPSSMMLPSSTTEAGAASSSSVHYPARAAEEDTRPARVRNL